MTNSQGFLYNNSMRCKSTVLFLALCIVFSSCASTGAKHSSQKEPELPAFLDWQYNGFGSEYPLWCEAALKNDVKALKEYFPQLEGRENDLQILLTAGDDIDMCTHNAMENDSYAKVSELVAQTWVLTSGKNKQYPDKYIYIKLYLAKSEEDSI